MPTQIELCYWYDPWPGHIAMKIWDTKRPEHGYYVSSEYRNEIKYCLQHNQTMDYENFFQSELVRYGDKCMKMKLPVTGLPLDVLVETREFFNKEYSLSLNNCAHIVAKMLHFLQFIHNERIEQVSYLEPKMLYTCIMAQGTSFKPVTAIEYAYAQINEDLSTLRAFSDDLDKRKHHDAANATIVLIANIKQELMNFALIQNKTIQEWQKVQVAISKIVKDSDYILSQHRGYKKIVGNLLLSIVMLGIIYALAILVKGAITGKFLFFSDTKTSAIANRIADNAYKVHEIVPIDSKIDTNQEQKVHFDEKPTIYEIKNEG